MLFMEFMLGFELDICVCTSWFILRHSNESNCFNGFFIQTFALLFSKILNLS